MDEPGGRLIHEEELRPADSPQAQCVALSRQRDGDKWRIRAADSPQAQCSALSHFTATGFVFNAREEVLLVKHRKLGVWLPPGGHVEENELPDDAVLREIREETGVTADILPNRLGIVPSGCRELETPFLILLEDIAGDGSHNHIDLIYLCTTQDETLTPDYSEVDDAAWFTESGLEGLETFENVLQTAEKAFAAVRNLS